MMAFAAELEIPVKGSVPTMKKDLKNFVQRRGVSHVQSHS